MNTRIEVKEKLKVSSEGSNEVIKETEENKISPLDKKGVGKRKIIEIEQYNESPLTKRGKSKLEVKKKEESNK